MEEIIKQFAVKGEPVCMIRFGAGHINETYFCACDSGLTYILQKINKSVFQKPEELMENIAAVTAYLGRQNDDPRASVRLVPALDGSNYIVDAAGEY